MERLSPRGNNWKTELGVLGHSKKEPVGLTQEQIRCYHENGYLGGAGVFSAEEITELYRVTDEYIEKSRYDPAKIRNPRDPAAKPK